MDPSVSSGSGVDLAHRLIRVMSSVSFVSSALSRGSFSTAVNVFRMSSLHTDAPVSDFLENKCAFLLDILSEKIMFVSLFSEQTSLH